MLKRIHGQQPTRVVADLGLDEDDEGSVPLAASGRPNSSQRKKRRAALLADEVIQLDVPTLPGHEQTMAIQILNRHLTDAVWIQCDMRHLQWFRNYMRCEIKKDMQMLTVSDQGQQGNHQNHEPTHKGPMWCSAAACWRVKVKGGKVHNFYVARQPDDTFRERCDIKRAEAERCYAALVVDVEHD